jgi:hypothetical protein
MDYKGAKNSTLIRVMIQLHQNRLFILIELCCLESKKYKFSSSQSPSISQTSIEACTLLVIKSCIRRTSQWRSILMIMGGGGSVPNIAFKQNSYFTYFMKLFWSRATRKATNHLRKDPVS